MADLSKAIDAQAVTLVNAGVKATYSAAIPQFTPAATPTDMVTISGSATKIVRVTRVELSATQAAINSLTFFAVKRSSVNTAGTSTSPTIVPLDSAIPAATAVVKSFTANPTLGTLVGNVRITKILVPASTAGTQTPQYLYDFSNDGLCPGFVLRGVGETLAINFNGAALPAGLNIAANIEWTEE